jgi:hypothetical protein
MKTLNIIYEVNLLLAKPEIIKKTTVMRTSDVRPTFVGTILKMYIALCKDFVFN